MRSTRSVSIPLSLLVTFCVWSGFLWTMQHAPSSRLRREGDFGGARSSGGLANQFASTVVKFFDNQDPREISEDNPAPEPLFEGQVVELLPLPKENREQLTIDLPEVYANPSLSSQDLFRSDVDLDGDNDLDLALLIRTSKTEAMGAVLEYVGDDRFLFAGSFRCDTTQADDFNRCFQVLRTGGGRLHILSRMPNVLVENPDDPDPAKRLPAEGLREAPAVPGWRVLRMEEGKVTERARFRDPLCPDEGRARDTGTQRPTEVRPVGDTGDDLIRFTSHCGSEALCMLVRYDSATGLYRALSDPAPSSCEEPEESQPAPSATR